MNPPAKRILVVDDQRAFAESLEVVLNAQDEVESVDVAPSAEEAIKLFAAVDRMDVVVIDVDLSGLDGVETVRTLVDEHPDLTVVVLTGVPDATVLARAAAAGAHAFLVKDSSLDEILDAILHSAPDRGIRVDSSTVREIVESGDSEGPDLAELLTPRELEVLGLLAEGRHPKEIAGSLGISVHTCRDYVKSLLAKLDAHSALEAVVIANRTGIITLPTE